MVIKKFDQSELAQKFMHIEINVTCIHTNFGGRDYTGFGDTAIFKNNQISLSNHGL